MSCVITNHQKKVVMLFYKSIFYEVKRRLFTNCHDSYVLDKRAIYSNSAYITEALGVGLSSTKHSLYGNRSLIN